MQATCRIRSQIVLLRLPNNASPADRRLGHARTGRCFSLLHPDTAVFKINLSSPLLFMGVVSRNSDLVSAYLDNGKESGGYILPKAVFNPTRSRSFVKYIPKTPK